MRGPLGAGAVALGADREPAAHLVAEAKRGLVPVVMTIGIALGGGAIAIVPSLGAVSLLWLLDKWMARNDEE